MTKLEARTIVGGLSNPSKMPGFAWGIPAILCIIGSKLRNVANSVCSGCYALKGAYAWSTTQEAYRRRLQRFNDMSAQAWVSTMSTALKGETFFRWLDSGDIQSVSMLQRIADVCRSTPTIQHWLPTREYALVKQYLQTGTVPANLTIVLSAHLRSTSTVTHTGPSEHGLPTSGVIAAHRPKLPHGFKSMSHAEQGKALTAHQRKLVAVWNEARKAHPAFTYVCPSIKQDNACGNCRTCWNLKPGESVAYIGH